MAKVIGQDPKLLRQCSCTNCASVIEYALNEVLIGKHYSYDGSADIVYYIKCPSCSKDIDYVQHY